MIKIPTAASIATTIAMSALLFLALIPAAFSLSFNMSFIRNSDGLLNLTGDAYINDRGLQLTTNEWNQASNNRTGRAIYKESLHLWNNQSQKLADFTTQFSFLVDSSGRPDFGDGLAFFLAPEGSRLEKWKQASGLGLGGATTGASPMDAFVAVEFDTHSDPVIDPPNDGGGGGMVVPHVGIDLDNVSSVATAPWYNNVTQTWVNDAFVKYDSATKILRVDFVGVYNGKNQVGSLSYEVDLRDYLPEYVTVGFSAATGNYYETHNVRSWNFSSTDVSSNQDPVPKNPNTNKNKKWLIFGLSGGGILLVLVFASAFTFCFLLPKKENEEEVSLSDSAMDMEFEKGNRPIKFSYNELVLATDDFAGGRKLGEGGFGSVYKGYLRSNNTYIAVKKVSEGSEQGRKEYAAEVKIISQLRHINLVELLGWCHQRAELLLVYEFMPNGSLDHHLFKLNTVLTWEIRYRIAQGLASALLYLHEELRQYVVHRDIKSSNVMLDDSFNAKLGDFGLARLVDHDKNLQSTSPAGTVGYMAPEYPITGKASKETDVYSFGVVLLEIACGRRPIDRNLCRNEVVMVEWVWSLYGCGELLDAADPKLEWSENDGSRIERMMVVGLWCAHPDSSLRPRMRQVVQVLYSEAPLPRLPLEMPKVVYNNDATASSGSSSTHNHGGGGGASSDLILTTSTAGSSDLLPR